MSERSQIYEVARIGAVITAGIFTGLSVSSPIYSLPSISAFSPSKTAKSKSYSTSVQKLSPTDRLTLFQTIHETTGAVAIPTATISSILFALAAYFSPANIAYNTAYLGRGAGEIGTRFPSDSLLTRLTAPRALLIGSSVALLSVLPISSFISEKAARSALSLRARLAADASVNTAAIGVSDSEKQLDKSLASWASGIQLASLAGFIATVAGTLQLTGYAL